jgi:TM2 domain-containing membrane protein YozV
MSTQAYSNQQAIFYQQYEAVRRDEIVGVLLALFLGVFGAHHFYLRRTGMGILYVCLTITCVGVIFTGPASFIECFFMPGRVREFNAIQAAGIASMLGIPTPVWAPPVDVAVNMPPAPQTGTLTACPHCGQTNATPARFCSACGAPLGAI